MFIESFMEGDRLEKLENELKSARILNKKKCVCCGFCCNKRTCIPTPNELKEIAKFLKLTSTKLINKYFAIDKQGYGSDYYVKPLGINIKDLAGQFIPDERTYNEGQCIFLEKDKNRFKCKIYLVRPNSAKLQECWNSSEKSHSELSGWKENKLEKEFKIRVDEDESKDYLQ